MSEFEIILGYPFTNYGELKTTVNFFGKNSLYIQLNFNQQKLHLCLTYISV